jgi:transcription-repair coupling factor (superfamily II helicase)
MYKRNKMLKEIAEKRLEAIKEFTELGSGFKIAMRDLEIRGAGTLLGRSQHGHMQAVGYDLYCKMLNEAVKTLKGIPTIEDFNTVIDLEADAYIPPSYIVNEVQKLDIYKRIAGIENEKECEDMREELLDRFGEIPKSVDHLLRIALIRAHAHRLYVTEVKGKNETIRFLMRTEAPIAVERIPDLLLDYRGRMSFDPKGTPSFCLRYKKCGVIEKDEELLLSLTEQTVADMERYLLPVDSFA